MKTDILTSFVIIFGASALVVFLLSRLRIPPIVGFLVAGVAIGPYGIGLVTDTHSVEIMAEVGVILLLFTIGIEFSLSRLMRMKKAVLGGGGVQVALTIGASALVSYFVTGDAGLSVFFGFLVALSSTAIVLKMLAEKGELDSPHGRTMTGILIFQDLCVIPFMLLTPSLSGGAVSAMDVLARMVTAVAIVLLVLLSARWIVPRLLYHVVRTKSRELFITTIILLCLGIALLTSRLGLSLALGAFLAGLIVSDSEYAHQATADILPFKDSFIGLFFVSVGMLMNVGYMKAHFLTIGLAVALIFGLKVVTGIVSALVTGSPPRASLQVGLGLAQIGEFSFVLALAGRTAGLIREESYQIFLSSSVVTMMMTPFVLQAAPSLSGWLASRHLLKRLGRIRAFSEREGFPRKREGHVIIIGFGVNGRNLARVLRETGIPYVVLEMNSDTVREMKRAGEPIYYGDGASRDILERLSVNRAKLLVVAISDPVSTRRMVSIARQENPALYIIVRTRYVAEVDDLKTLGANEVIPEEFETSVEIFSRVLQQYRFPHNLILDMADRIRDGSYTALRRVDVQKRRLFEECEWLPEMDVNGFRIGDSSPLAGKTIGELQIRKRTGVTVIAVRRGPAIHTSPDPDFRLKAGDIMLFTGERKSMDNALNYFRAGP